MEVMFISMLSAVGFCTELAILCFSYCLWIFIFSPRSERETTSGNRFDAHLLDATQGTTNPAGFFIGSKLLFYMSST